MRHMARDDICGVHDMTIGSTNPDNRGIDALLPAEIAEKAETVGVQKTKLDVLSLLALASWRALSSLSVRCLQPLFWRERTVFFPSD